MNDLMLYLMMIISGIIPLMIIMVNIGVLSDYRRGFWIKGDLDKVTKYDFRIRKAKVFLKYFVITYLILSTIIYLIKCA